MPQHLEDEAMKVGARLLTQFCVMVDDGRFDELAMLFAEDGRLSRWGETIEGRESILANMRQRSPTRLTEHVLGNVLVEHCSEAAATVRAVMTVYRHDPGVAIEGPAPLGGPATIARCRADLARGAEGWTITHLDVHPPRFAA